MRRLPILLLALGIAHTARAQDASAPPAPVDAPAADPSSANFAAMRVAERGGDCTTDDAQPVGVTPESINGALAALAARIPVAEPPAPAEPPALPAETEETPEESLPEALPEEKPMRFEQHTLFGTTRRSGRFGAHLGVSFDVSQFDGTDSGAWGFEGGVVIGGNALLGGGIYATELVDLGDQAATFVYGGFQPGLILWTEAVVHPRLDVLIGGGAAFDPYTGALLGEAGVIVPRVGLELNVSRAIRASGNLGWRFVRSDDADTSKFSSFAAGLSFRLGWM